jgi:hypothetical protein
VCDKDWATHNAYGLSAVNGGLEDIRRRMLSLKRGQYNYYCYGDDTDIYYRDAKGVLYRKSPDFSQMDGYVDSDTVYLVVKWIYRSLARKYGESHYWAHVCQEWYYMALNPEFVCDGPTVYCKDMKHGLGGIMSGVVGTTLSDTVKSVLSYDAFISDVKMNNLLKDVLLEMRKACISCLEKGMAW